MTSFLIELERERHRQTRRPAPTFLEGALCLTATTAGELAAGPPRSVEVCCEYGRAFRYLSDNGLLIGANDLWIAATAIANQLPLVTRNGRHFARVPKLQVIGYLPPSA